MKDDVTVSELVRSRPGETALLALAPTGVAALQLLNSYVNELSFAISVPFAVVLLAFAALLVQHHLAQFRRRLLDGGVTGPPSD